MDIIFRFLDETSRRIIVRGIAAQTACSESFGDFLRFFLIFIEMETIRLLAPERKTTVEANIVQPLAEFIRATYSDNVLADHIGALQTVNKMREDVRHSVEKTDKTLALYVRYDAMLASMETRFLLGDGDAGNIKLEFSWTDSANPKKKRGKQSPKPFP